MTVLTKNLVKETFQPWDFTERAEKLTIFLTDILSYSNLRSGEDPSQLSAMGTKAFDLQTNVPLRVICSMFKLYRHENGRS